MSKKPVVLLILDGYGINEKEEGNAILQANTRQENTATALAIFTTLVSGLLFYTGGLGNWGGSLFFGALLSVAQVSLFYLLEGRKDRTSRIIYTVSGLLAVTAAGLLLLLSL